MFRKPKFLASDASGDEGPRSDADVGGRRAIVDPIEPHDVRGLARLVAAVDAAFDAVERDALAEVELRPWMFRLLDYLARAGATAPSDVARDLGVAPPTVSGWIADLTQRGLIERVGDEHDQRRATIGLTTAGSELRTKAADAIRGRQLRLAARIDPVEQSELARTLQRLAG